MRHLDVLFATEKKQSVPVKCLAHDGSIKYYYKNY